MIQMTQRLSHFLTPASDLNRDRRDQAIIMARKETRNLTLKSSLSPSASVCKAFINLSHGHGTPAAAGRARACQCLLRRGRVRLAVGPGAPACDSEPGGPG